MRSSDRAGAKGEQGEGGPPPPHRPAHVAPAARTGRSRPAWLPATALGLTELGALAALGWWPGGASFPREGLALFAVAFGAYALAALAISRVAGGGALVWGAAIVMRLALLPLTPELSDDVYRYLWDGRVQLAGVNPYLHPPAAPDLEALRTPYHALVNNADVRTIYPPLTQAMFVLIGVLGGTVLAAKLVWLAFDLATAWVLGRIALRTDRDPRRVQLLYLWSPLLVVEVAWSAHLEPLGLLAMALAILWGRRPIAAGAALAVAALAKFAPAAALPALVRRGGWKPVAAFAGVVGTLYLPYVGAGSALFDGLRTYSEHWWFMKGPFVVLEAAFPDPLRARAAAAVVVLGVVAWTVYRRHDTERTLLWVLGAGMILTPTLHPWYVLWTLPMAALRASRPWLLLSGLAFLGYFGLDAYQQTGEWPQPAWLRAVLWVPFLVALAADALRDRSGRARAAPVTG